MQDIDIHLAPIDQSNWRRALHVRTLPGQLKFVADFEPVTLIILSKCYVRPGDLHWRPFAISVDDEIVGVVAIVHSKSRCDIYHFVIDYRHQRLGIGKAAMRLIIEHISRTWPHVTRVRLSVHPHNEVAMQLYQSVGFSATGEEQDGEPVLELSLSA